MKHNPDYLQILSEMGYYYKIDKKLRSKIRGYGPEAELLYCEYCDGVNPVDGGFCVNCMAPLPEERPRPPQKKNKHEDENELRFAFFILFVCIFLIILCCIQGWGM